MHTCGAGTLRNQNELGKNINGSRTTSSWDSSLIILSSVISSTATRRKSTTDHGRCTFVTSIPPVRSEKFQEAIKQKTRGGRLGWHITGNLNIGIVPGSVPLPTCPWSNR